MSIIKCIDITENMNIVDRAFLANRAINREKNRLHRYRNYILEHDDGRICPSYDSDDTDSLVLQYRLLRIRQKLDEFMYYSDREIYRRVAPVLLKKYFDLNS